MSNFVNAKKATAKKPRSQTSLSVSGTDAPAASSSSSASSSAKTKRASGSLSSVGRREELDPEPVEIKSATGRVSCYSIHRHHCVFENSTNQFFFFFFFFSFSDHIQKNTGLSKSDVFSATGTSSAASAATHSTSADAAAATATLEELQHISTLSLGSYSYVTAVKHTASGDLFALKVAVTHSRLRIARSLLTARVYFFSHRRRRPI
jgi:hypothetical protein